MIAKIAGKQFFAWIQDLLNSNEFDYDSVFSLIPNFEECKERYEEDEDVVKFIEEFQEGFEEELEEGAIIPVEEDGQMVLKPLNEVNYDVTGITCTNLMSDDEVREYMEWTDFFPHNGIGLFMKQDQPRLCSVTNWLHIELTCQNKLLPR